MARAPDRSESAIIVLVMAAAGLVLAAPIVGRNGSPRWADAAMIAAALSGIAAFVLAAANTHRSTRRARGGEKGDSP